MRPLIDPPLHGVARAIVSAGIGANQMTLAGLGAGLAAAAAVVLQNFEIGLVLIFVCRLADGLDGAIARIQGKTAFGGYLDIFCDYTFYAVIPLAFGIAVPDAHTPALVLIASFLLSGASFLASAIVAAQKGWESRDQGEKSFYYLAGLAEGTETIAVFAICCIWPEWFSIVAYFFAALCVLTAIGRTMLLRSMLASVS